MVSQRDLAKSGPRGGSDSRDSGGLGSSSNPGRHDPGRDRLQNQDRGGSGPFGRDPLEQSDSGSGGAEPTEPKGLLEALGDLDLRAADEAIQRGVAPGEPLPFDDPSRRPGRRNPNDEERPALKPVVAEEEEPVLSGDPLNLGARGNRRRTQNGVNASPVLRRGLLGL